eukprot:15440549-Alexandrium_andersonii.AAC.1
MPRTKPPQMPSVEGAYADAGPPNADAEDEANADAEDEATADAERGGRSTNRTHPAPPSCQ